MKKEQGLESWYEGIGLIPFPGYAEERAISREHAWMTKVQKGLKRGYIDMHVAKSLSMTVSLLPKNGSYEREISLRNGGLLTVTDISDSDAQSVKLQFCPERSNGINFSAYYDTDNGLLLTPGCFIQFDSERTDGRHVFDSSDPATYEQSLTSIRNDLRIVRNVLDEAVQS